jgi:hypothetical protein
MTDPASAIQREVQQLVDFQIATLRNGLSLTNLDLHEYQIRAERILNLFSVLDRIGDSKIPKWHPRLRARNRKSISGRD